MRLYGQETDQKLQVGGDFKSFYFHPYLGKIPILTNIFQMGWNHHLDKVHPGRLQFEPENDGTGKMIFLLQRCILKFHIHLPVRVILYDR